MVNHARIRRNGNGGLRGLLNKFGINTHEAMREEALNSRQEARIRTVRAREIDQQNALKARMTAYKTELSGLQHNLGTIDQDISGYRAQLAVEKRPAVADGIRVKMVEKMATRGSLLSRIESVKRKARNDKMATENKLRRLRAANTAEINRIVSGDHMAGDVQMANVDMGKVAMAFGRGTMDFWNTEGDIETISFQGVTAEHEDHIPTSNLTVEDLPYWLEQDNAEFHRGMEYLLQRFKICTLKRKYLIQMYYSTNNPEYKKAIERNEATYKSLREQVYDMRAVQQQSTRISKNVTPDRDIPSYNPINRFGLYRGGPLTSESSQPTPIPTKSPVKLPTRDQHLRDYIPAIRRLVKTSNRLSREYTVATLSEEKGEWSEDASEDYSPDEGTYQRYTTVGTTKKRPPKWRTGVPPPDPNDRAPTLMDMTIRSSSDLAGVAGNSIIKDVGEPEVQSVPIHNLLPLRLPTKQDVIDKTMEIKRRMEEAL